MKRTSMTGKVTVTYPNGRIVAFAAERYTAMLRAFASGRIVPPPPRHEMSEAEMTARGLSCDDPVDCDAAEQTWNAAHSHQRMVRVDAAAERLEAAGMTEEVD